MKISFKPLATTDFEKLLQWLQQHHVKKWWDADISKKSFLKKLDVSIASVWFVGGIL
ncbi:MAG: hypothetical protein DGJ47_000935 [Rickettsiaceae bacterium]